MSGVNSFLGYLMPSLALVFVVITVIEMSFSSQLNAKVQDVLFRISFGTTCAFLVWGFAGIVLGVVTDLKI